MKDGTFWVLSTGGLDVFDRRTGKVTGSIPLAARRNSSMLGVGTRVRLLADHAGTIWVTMPFGSGLAMVDRDSMKLVEYSFEDVTGDNPVEAIHEDEDGNLWLGSDNGLLKISPDRKTFVRYRHIIGDPDSLSADQVRSLFEDREGNIWVGTQGGGVNRFTARQGAFTNYRHEPGNPNSLEKDEVTSVYEDSRGILWVGNRVALNRIDRKTGKVTVYRDAGGPGRLSNTYILSIVEDHAGFLWFGTSGGGLNRFDPRDGNFKTYLHDPSRPGSLSDNIVYCLFVDRQGTLWAGTNRGLDRYNPRSDRFQNYRTGDLEVSNYRTIDEDATGALWLSTLVAGVHRLDPATGSHAIYRHTSAAGSLTNDWVNMARVDRQGIVWGATARGLNRLDPATGRSTAYFERDGLPNDNLNGVLVDDDGDLWVSTNNGLSRFNPRTNRFRNYYASDGLVGNEFYRRNCAWKSPRGEMFFCSSVGLTAFFPKDIANDSYVPPVVLTDFLLSDKPVPVGGDSPLKKSITVTQFIVLQPYQNIFSFEFAALSYANPERNRYRYRLEGLEKEWKERDSSHRTVTYTTLPAGTYIFRVQGSSNRGTWNEAGTSVVIRILPPWWKTWWFGAVCATSILIALWYAHQFRLAQIAQQLNVRFEERFAERTRIAQELHDTMLQAILSASMQLHVAADCLPSESPLKPRLAQILDLISSGLQEGRNAVQNLRHYHRDCVALDQAFLHIPHQLAAQDKVQFRVVLEGHPRPLHPVVRDEVYRIGREAVTNAFRHAGAESIEVELEYAKDRLRLIVRDDGHGIDSKILRSGREGHWGLLGMRERAARISAQLLIRSSGMGGTEIDLCVPARTAFRRQANRRAIRWPVWQTKKLR